MKHTFTGEIPFDHAQAKEVLSKMKRRRRARPGFEHLEPRLLLSSAPLASLAEPIAVLDANAGILVESLSTQSAVEFARIAPLGGLMSASVENSDSLTGNGDHSDFTFFAESGQTIAAIATPTSTSVTLAIQLVGQSVAFSAVSAGEPAVLPATAIPIDGTYTVRVSGNGAADHSVDIYRNAAIEAQVGDSGDGNELSIDSTLIDLGSGRMGMIGTSTSFTIDEITFTGSASERINAVLDASGKADFSGEQLQLLGTDGATVLATASAASGSAAPYDLAILGIDLPATGTYTLRLTSFTAGNYGLIVTKGLTFDREPNDTVSDPLLSLAGTSGALGTLGDNLLATGNAVEDGDFEIGPTSSAWTVTEDPISIGFAPLCHTVLSACPAGEPNNGEGWAHLGERNLGFGEVVVAGVLSQSVTIPTGNVTLSFFLKIKTTADPFEYDFQFVDVTIDGSSIFFVDAFSENQYEDYTEVSVAVPASLADGDTHTLAFNAMTINVQGVSQFMVDDVQMTRDISSTSTSISPVNSVQSPEPSTGLSVAGIAASMARRGLTTQMLADRLDRAEGVSAAEKQRIIHALAPPDTNPKTATGIPHHAVASEAIDLPYVPGRLIVRYADDAKGAIASQAASACSGRVLRQYSLFDGAVIELDDPDVDIFEAAAAWSADPSILYAEPSYRVHTTQTLPDDTRFSEQWGLHNTGQTGGTADADIDAPEAWNDFTGSTKVVIASIDTGVDYTHPDLAGNMWANPDEIPGDGIDNDNNGHIDDIHGIDTINNDSDPFDDSGHGTHTAGTFGAFGNNGQGVAGANWDVQIMAIKFIGADGFGDSADAITALQYMTMMKTQYGINIVASNNSWGDNVFSQALKDAIQASNNAGIMFVTAAGNGGSDGIGDNNDATPLYPASYNLPGIISVAATDHSDQRATFSNFGVVSVDLGAPGASILNTVPVTGDPLIAHPSRYHAISGTSMASPHVAGAVGMLMAAHPTATLTDVKAAIFSGVDPISSMSGITATGGRLNLANALAQLGATGPKVGRVDPKAGPNSDLNITDITINFTEPITSASALNSSNYELIGAGANGLLGDGDDVTITVTPGFDGGRVVTLTIDPAFTPLALGSYQLTIDGDSSIVDLDGDPLNSVSGPGGGSDEVQQFDIMFVLEAGGDLFTFSATANDLVTLSTRTPFDNATSTPLNTLDPRLTVIGPSGLPVAQDDDSLDGRNATASFTASESGTYHVQISAETGAGEYLLAIDLLHGAPVPHFDDFEDGVANYFTTQSGTWDVNESGRYHGEAPADGHAISLLSLADPLPTDHQIDVLIRGEGAGVKQNAYVIFDYQSITDFKYAGAAIGADKWRIGHFDGTHWLADALFGETIDVDADYQVQVRLEDTTATLLVDGIEKVSVGFGEPLNDGQIGLATNNAEAVFDEFRVAPVTIYFEDFNDGVADGFAVQSGTWDVNESGRYHGEAPADGHAIALLSLAAPLPTDYQIDVLIRGEKSGVKQNAYAIFDYQSITDFKYAGATIGADKWRIGHFDGTHWLADALFAETIDVDADHQVQVRLENTTATLLVGGIEKVSFDFGDPLNDGQIGLGANDAGAVFDDLTILDLLDGATLPHAEDFGDGKADFFDVQLGTWHINQWNRYRGEAALGTDAITLLQTAAPLPDGYQFDATMRSKATGEKENMYIIFDYRSPTDFKYAGAAVGVGKWKIGHSDGSSWATDATFNEAIASNTNYDLSLQIADTTAMLLVDGIEKVSLDFGTSLNGGQIGFAAHDSHAIFDDLSVTEWFGPAEAQHVIHISVDGLRSDAVAMLGATAAPNFYRLRNEGAFTDNARTDFDHTTTLPNHTSQLTGRGVDGPDGHNWTINSTTTAIIHDNKGSYVESVFDVVHDHDRSTGMYASKDKFDVFDRSYDATNGALDQVGVDGGRDKIDTYVYNSNTSTLVNDYVTTMGATPFEYSFLHLRDPDSAGHGASWDLAVGSTYLNSVATIDGLLGQVFNMIDTTPALTGNTAVIVTADHGGTLDTANHGNEAVADNYTIPFYIWGPSIDAAADLYTLNAIARLDPSTGRPPYSDPVQPVRNGDVANLVLDLLGLPPVTGSTSNNAMDLAFAVT